MGDRKKQANILRISRKIHRLAGIILFVFFFIVAITSLLLGWKKNSYGLILPDTQRGITTDLKKWLPADSLQIIALQALKNHVHENINLDVKRIDIRPDKGVAKFVFDQHYYGVQVDGATGQVLAITTRRSDLIENIHDGSILDAVFKTNSDVFKLLYTTIMGVALLLFTITGFWLWFGPKRMRKKTR